MRLAARLRTLAGCLLATLGLSTAMLATPASAAAQATPDDAGCAVTGYLPEGGRGAVATRAQLSELDAFSLGGVGLRSTQPWVIPDGSEPLLVVDSSAQLSSITVEAYVAGMRVYRWRESRGQPGLRYAALPELPMLGDVTRTVGLRVESGPCGAMTVVAVDRAPWSTRVGQAGLALTALLAAALVTVARWRRGDWLRRFLWAAPIGLLTAAAEVVVLYESGRADPFGGPPWWPFAVGLALAAVLPLTRRRRDRRADGQLPEALPVRQLIAAGAELTGPQVTTLTLGVLAQLSAAHARGATPGVRPETIWLDRAGRVWLADSDQPPAPPYAGPEQGPGGPTDPRSDVWACGVVLAELLTGRPPAGPHLPELPAPLAEVVARALAADPTQRFESAEAFATALRSAAERQWGPDWVGRGALAGALVAHGAIGSAAAGYVATGAGGAPAGLAGLGAGSPAGGAAAGAASAGAGAVSATGTGAFSATSAGLGSAGAVLAAGGAAVPVAGVAAGGAGALINAGAAAAAAVAVVAGAVVTGGVPAPADTPVITPEQARVIVVRTLDEARAGGTAHLSDEVASGSTLSLLEQHPEVSQARIAEVVVGVPPDQYDYPAWFIGSAQLRFDGGVVHLLGQFERDSDSARWQMVTMSWLLDEPVGEPRLDDDGWLLSEPEPAELLVDPAQLPRLYADWSRASFDAGRHVEDPLLRTRALDDGRETIRDYRVRSVTETRDDNSITQEIVLDDAEPTVVWLDDGGALVSFTVVSHQTVYNTPHPGQTRPCDTESGFYRWAPDPTVRYRQLSYYAVVQVLAWVPTRDSAESHVLVLDPRPSQRLDRDRSIRC